MTYVTEHTRDFHYDICIKPEVNRQKTFILHPVCHMNALFRRFFEIFEFLQ